MDAVNEGYEGKYMNENDLAFFLYLNVEIMRVLLIFSINKILTSACDCYVKKFFV